jgi:phosphonate transport system permease protein
MTPAADHLAAARAIAPELVVRPLPARLMRGGAAALAFGAFGWLCASIGLTPATLFAGLDKLGVFLAAMVPPSAGGDPMRVINSLAMTFAMAFAGTALAVAAALPLGLAGAKTILAQPMAHFALRRVFDVFRGIPALVWALILVSAFGLGPFAGVLALALADIPQLAKQYAEAIENAETGPQDAVRAAGGGPLAAIRFGLAPQVAPVIASQSLFCLEGNFRNAAVLGIVGAGGIGLELEERIRIFAFDQVAFIVILYVLCVMALDMISARLRAALA